MGEKRRKYQVFCKGVGLGRWTRVGGLSVFKNKIPSVLEKKEQENLSVHCGGEGKRRKKDRNAVVREVLGAEGT